MKVVAIVAMKGHIKRLSGRRTWTALVEVKTGRNELVPDQVESYLELARRHGPIDRLFSALEMLQVPMAEARERLGVPGMSAEAARNFRDKARMKDVLRAAGLPCARHGLAASEAEAWRFAEQIGYPLVVKPPAGAGTVTTFQVESPEALKRHSISVPSKITAESRATGKSNNRRAQKNTSTVTMTKRNWLKKVIRKSG